MMSLVENILTAWDKTMETNDPAHLGAYLDETFEFLSSDDSVNSKAETLEWSAAGGLRIGNFKTVYEDNNVSCASHNVTEDGAGPSTVLCFVKHQNGKATFWKILRAFSTE